MKAAVYTSYGSPEVLTINQIEQPALQEGDDEIVIIRVHSASVNPYDYLFRSGYLPVRLVTGGVFKPKVQILGIDVAGTVAAVGGRVERFKVGDRVYGGALGSHAEFVRANQKNLALLPEGVSFQAAAALPTAGQTALQAMRDLAQVQPGQKVLVYGASGGIGHYAVQLGKVFGAEVTAVCSTANLSWVQDLGADQVIDYTREDFAKNGKRYDLVYDTVGKRTFFNSRGALTGSGTYISEHPIHPWYNPIQIFLASLSGDKRAKSHLTRTNRDDLEFLGGLMAAGRLKSVIEETFPLERIVEAHRHVEGRHTKGKVIVEIP